jgi:bacteriorhodopsin
MPVTQAVAALLSLAQDEETLAQIPSIKTLEHTHMGVLESEANRHGIHSLHDVTRHDLGVAVHDWKETHMHISDLPARDLVGALQEVHKHFPNMRIPVSDVAIVAEAEGFLNPQDSVAISFWIISIAMVASTVFFLMESLNVSYKWKTSMNVGALVTLVAAVHYFYMREFWIKIHGSPIVYRYIDWTITVPLQMVEFYLILKAVNPKVSGGIFWRLLIGTVAMLTFGYMGENHIINAVVGFVLGCAGWGYILAEIFVGEAGKMAAGKIANENIKSAFGTMRFIVTVGWSIYPLGYFFGYLLGDVKDSPLNLVYNLADFVNKIAFCLAIWHVAKKSTSEEMAK